jgi:IS30 family transposase
VARSEQELRLEAVRRRLAGESPDEIARSLGRSRQWVAKWTRRHEAGKADWAQGMKRGPKRAANRTAAGVEAQVLAVRERLVANPWAQVGAEAIAWELRKLGIEPPPRRTIERIVARAGATRQRRRSRRQPKGVAYPAPPVERSGDVHEADLVGPRHLGGGVRFYVLNAVDLASHRCAIAICPGNADQQVASALVAVWQRLGLPTRLKFDNGGPFVGPKGLGLIARLCLHHAVIPHFIPAREPWRNGTVEHFNDTFDKRFFRQERFSSLEHLQERALAFEAFHNGNHRYRTLGGRTPQESAAGSETRSSRPLADLPKGWPPSGRVEFVRFIRSDRKLRLLNRAITVPESLVYEYVTAVLDLALPPAEGNLRVLREGEIVAATSIAIGAR